MREDLLAEIAELRREYEGLTRLREAEDGLVVSGPLPFEASSDGHETIASRLPVRQRGQIARLPRTGGTGVAPESHRRFSAVRPRGNPSPLPEEGGRWGAGAFGGTETAAVAAGEQNGRSAGFAGDARQVETAQRITMPGGHGGPVSLVYGADYGATIWMRSARQSG